VTRAYGIDLGTTYSVIATVDENGEPTVLNNPLGVPTTPSTVCFESPTSVLVGAAAKDAAPLLPDQTVSLVKRQMGSDGLMNFHGVDYSAESISALILRAVVAGAVPDHDDRRRLPVVVTVPAYFGVREREATHEAGLLARLDVLELITEPLAAAIHYGRSTPGAPTTVLVYDLGGGTFDATLLTFPTGARGAVAPAHARVLATDGDTELGGADWDRRLTAFLLERYLRAASPDDDPLADAAFMTELRLAAETAKRAISARTSHRVPLRRGNQVVHVDLSRADFEAMTADLVDSTLSCVRRLLDDAASVGAPAVDRCLLVGGSTRMPMIAAALTGAFGWPVSAHDPDLAVAKGAAIRAYQLCGGASVWVTPSWGTDVPVETASPADPRVTPNGAPPLSVVPRSFGLLVHDSHDATGTRTFVEHVIHRNEPLPVTDRESVVATILDNQAALRIEVFEQAGAVESAEVEHNRRVLDGELSGLPQGLPAGSAIHVGLSLGLDGRLSVTAREPRSGTRLHLDAYIDGVLDRDEHDRMVDGLARLEVRQ
jgi:molecular chaperone DnaK